MTISILDKGAAPTPGFDNTAAIQGALNDASTSAATRTVIIPPGVFETSRVTVPAGVKVIGDGGTLMHRPAATTEACMEIVGADVILRDVKIDGNKANQTVPCYGILVSADRSHLDNPTVINTSDTGILVSGRVGHRLAWARVRDAGKNGIGFTKPGSLIVATDFAVVGAQIERSNDGGIGVMGQNFAVVASTTKSTGGDGITAYADENGQYAVVANAIDGPGNNGIHSAGSNVAVVGNAIRNTTSRGIYHETQGQLLQDTAVLSSNAITKTGLAGIEAWPCLSLAVVANVVTQAGLDAYDIRRTDALALVGNIAGKPVGCGFIIRATRYATVTGNAGTGIGADLFKVADGGLTPTSLNGILSANAGNAITGKALNIADGAGWWTEQATIPGSTAADPFTMGAATNRRI